MKRLTLYRGLLALAGAFFALVAAEVICRVVVQPTPSIRFQQDIAELDGLNLDAATGMIQNDEELFWRLVPNTRLPTDAWPFFGVIANGQSLREERQIAPTKPEGQRRILFLGDSCTFGYGVAHDACFVAVAEARLQEAVGGGLVECINAGVPGYSLFQGYRYLATEGLALQPELVVLNFGWNDYGIWDELSDREHHALMQARRPPPLLRSSQLARLIWPAFAGKTETGGATAGKRPRMLPDEFLETLERIHGLAATREIPLLILVWPMRDNSDLATPPTLRSPLQLEMIAFGQAHPLMGSPRVSGVLDLIPLGRQLVGEHGVEAVYLDHGHVTELGHRAIGEAIAKHLEPWLQR